MSMKDVRDFLLKQMAELADSDLKGEELAEKVKKAQATSQVATTYISAVKTEIDAYKVFEETGKLPVAVEAPQKLLPAGR
jgi:hypothetical protein